MKLIVLCGVFDKSNELEVVNYARAPVEFSANIFQTKLVDGFKKNDVEYFVISAPFIGSFPNASSIWRFNGFTNRSEEYYYVKFNNLWGIRNISRTNSLKKALKRFMKQIDPNEDVQIVIYSPHTPFLQAAKYAKNIHHKTKICLVVPDLPQYMNLNEKISICYKIAKKYDIAIFNKLNYCVDSYVLLTETMTEKIDIHNRPYIVVEGLVTTNDLARLKKAIEEKKDITEHRYIVYAGKINRAFGIVNLIEAFKKLNDKNVKLILCGQGDCEEYVKSQDNENIHYLGQVSPEIAKEWMMKASVLVNPRENKEDFTKYSFPSKNIEYLLTGKPVVACRLEGIPDIYEKFIYFFDCNDSNDLTNKIREALETENDSKLLLDYFLDSCLVEKVCARIISMGEVE